MYAFNAFLQVTLYATAGAAIIVLRSDYESTLKYVYVSWTKKEMNGKYEMSSGITFTYLFLARKSQLICVLL